MNRICHVCKKKQFGGGINDPYLHQWFCSVKCHMVRLEEIILEPPPTGTECQDPPPTPPPAPKTPEIVHESPLSADSTEATPQESPQTDKPTTESKPVKKRSRRKKKTTEE